MVGWLNIVQIDMPAEYWEEFVLVIPSEERRIPFIFDDFHFCRSRVIGLDMTENRIFTLCRVIT